MNNKVGILTHYNVNNQGAQLQMYALAKKIEEFGLNPIILTYNKNFDFIDDSEKKKNIITVRSIPYFLKEFLLKKGIKQTYFNYKKYIKNLKFRKYNFNYAKYTEGNVDTAVVGSDEVFSIETGVNIMMYGHAVNCKRIISYAPSFGQTDIEKLEQKRCKELVKSGLSTFDYLSARDINTKEVIEVLTNREVIEVCDPVILYDFSREKTPSIKKIKKKYIVIYGYDRHFVDKDEINEIKKYAKKKKLLTVSVGTFHKWCDKNITCNCLEWMEYIRNSEGIITDTFHGTILSSITNRPMAIYVRDKINANKLIDLITKLGLENRRLNSITFEDIEKVFNNFIDFKSLNDKINQLREFSSRYLKEALNIE